MFGSFSSKKFDRKLEKIFEYYGSWKKYFHDVESSELFSFANYEYLDGFQAENKQFGEGLFSKVKSENHEKVQNPHLCSDLAQVWSL